MCSSLTGRDEKWSGLADNFELFFLTLEPGNLSLDLDLEFCPLPWDEIDIGLVFTGQPHCGACSQTGALEGKPTVIHMADLNRLLGNVASCLAREASY